MFLFSLLCFTLTAAFNITLNSLGPGSSYFLSTNLTIGSNKQKIDFVGIDTGSAIFWVNSIDCQNKKQACTGSKFNPSTSNTSSVTSNKFAIQYDDGTKFKGHYVTDNVFFGTRQTRLEFGLATKAKYPISDSFFNQALIGFAPACCGDPNTLLDIWFTNVTKVFSILLPSDLESKGMLLIGQYITNRTHLGTVSVDITSDEDWFFSDIVIQNENGTDITGHSTGIFDTGSDLLFLPQKELDAICNFVGWHVTSEGCIGLCSTVPNLPLLKLNFNKVVTLQLDLQDHFTFFMTNPTQCSLALIASSDDYGWTLGMAVLRQYFTQWDFSSNTVSFFDKDD